jgi:hypothetical protein
MILNFSGHFSGQLDTPLGVCPVRPQNQGRTSVDKGSGQGLSELQAAPLLASSKLRTNTDFPLVHVADMQQFVARRRQLLFLRNKYMQTTIYLKHTTSPLAETTVGDGNWQLGVAIGFVF